jgi:catechol 2,3-dioxygenase-like lactoylglutathione lyase family enzyme
MSSAEDWRIDHTGIGVSDIQRSAAFYDGALAALGLRTVMRITRAFELADAGATDDLGGVGYGVTYPIFWIDIFHPHGAKQHTAFRARSRAEVDDFHRIALSLGGRATAVRAFVKAAIRAATTPPSCLIPTETTSRRSSANHEGAGRG